jgi:2-polyprenyl-3-methyl-5-hydroxy-6-metoxy-1,4-benzoquinol methylase
MLRLIVTQGKKGFKRQVTGMKSLVSEAPSPVWDSLYRQGKTPWRSIGLSDTTRQLLKSYATGSKFLEIGCGVGDDAGQIAKMGFDYHGLDISESAIKAAKSRYLSKRFHFTSANFFRWSAKTSFDVVYEKGVFHGLGGVRRRNTFLRRVATLLRPKGIWITVCGSADHRRTDFCHGAIYLRDLIGPAEIYFEVLEVVKADYGLADQSHDFSAWHAAFCRR